MNNIRVIFCVVLSILLVILLGWTHHQGNVIEDLGKKYTTLQISLEDTQKTNALLRSEVKRINEIANEHHSLTSKTENDYKEMIDEIRDIEKEYKDWFNAECPIDLNGVLSKNCGKNKVPSNSVRAPGAPSK